MFDFTKAIEQLVWHIVGNCPDFAHIETERIAVSYIRTRLSVAHGVYASVQPLRFEGGATSIKRGRRTYAMPQVLHEGKEMLYIVSFALPRFMNLSFQDKIVTIFHELYHISPEFNGDIRRFPGRKYAHGYSRKRYNEHVKSLAESYLLIPGSEESTAFLHQTFNQLEAEHGGIIGTKARSPKPKVIV